MEDLLLGFVSLNALSDRLHNSVIQFPLFIYDSLEEKWSLGVGNGICDVKGHAMCPSFNVSI